jgi:hypothetical protein
VVLQLDVIVYHNHFDELAGNRQLMVDVLYEAGCSLRSSRREAMNIQSSIETAESVPCA